jgi:N-acetylglucosaminyldiphosphoundecaprenol N-acetyl-beta-D-mannosaminyltransferase
MSASEFETPREGGGATAGLTVADLPRARILGVDVVAARLNEVVGAVQRILTNEPDRCAILCPTGVHGLIAADEDPEFKALLNSAELTVADGMPLVFVSKMLGHHTAERAFGPEVMLAILERAAVYGAKHYFYGGREGVAEELRSSLCGRFPNLRVVGTFCPPFRSLSDEELDDMAALINRSGADVVWVGLSTPKQERWAARMRDRLDAKLICTVGAAFDYHTGSIREAPAWMKALALEWLFRLLQEPRRLWRRYFKIVPKFLVLISMQLVRGGTQANRQPAKSEENG